MKVEFYVIEIRASKKYGLIFDEYSTLDAAIESASKLSYKEVYELVTSFYNLPEILNSEVKYRVCSAFNLDDGGAAILETLKEVELYDN